MTDFMLIIIGIIAAILTVWYVVLPAIVVAGTVTAFRHRGPGLRQERKEEAHS